MDTACWIRQIQLFKTTSEYGALVTKDKQLSRPMVFTTDRLIVYVMVEVVRDNKK